jgi:hypothetical protein
MSSLGFIVLRHMTNATTALYWKECVERIRTFHPGAPILLIDDNSNPAFVRTEDEEGLQVVQSEYPGRGELLPYIYYLTTPFCETVCILHDSVFMNAPLDVHASTYKMLWSFEHWYDLPADERAMLSSLKNAEELLSFYDESHRWKGCFGSMTILRHSFLTQIDARHDIRRLLENVKSRADRSLFERVIACLLQYYDAQPSVFGDIFAYCPWGISFEQRGAYSHLPLTKVWSAR